MYGKNLRETLDFQLIKKIIRSHQAHNEASTNFQGKGAAMKNDPNKWLKAIERICKWLVDDKSDVNKVLRKTAALAKRSKNFLTDALYVKPKVETPTDVARLAISVVFAALFMLPNALSAIVVVQAAGQSNGQNPLLLLKVLFAAFVLGVSFGYLKRQVVNGMEVCKVAWLQFGAADRLKTAGNFCCASCVICALLMVAR